MGDERPGRDAALDPIEAEMADRGVVVHRDKLVARGLALISLLMTVGFGAVSVAYLMGWQPGTSMIIRWLTYLLPLLGITVGLTRTVLRTAVTPAELRVHWGWTRLHVPIASITRCEAVALRVRAGFASATTQAGPLPMGGVEQMLLTGDQAVYLEWVDERGKARKTLMGAGNPAALAASIQQARSGAGARVRVEAEPIGADVAEDAIAEESSRVARR